MILERRERERERAVHQPTLIGPTVIVCHSRFTFRFDFSLFERRNDERLTEK